MKLATGIAALSLAVASIYSAPSFAVAENKGSVSNPAARCQGALPAFETAIRKRPLAVQNEGTSNAFITCSFEGDTYDATSVVGIDTYFTNNTAAAVTLSCTGVSGYQGGTNSFVSMSVSIPANGSGNPFWVAQDFESGLAEGLISISCSLPPGVGINDTYLLWTEDDA